MPKVTLCVPAYNAERTLAETLESLLAQTYRDSEIIVSDNHSTDRTREVVETFRSKGVKLVVCPKPPVKEGTLLDNCLSAFQNWNSLRDLGTGAYVGIYHADDVYERDIVAREVEALERRPEGSAAFSIIKTIDAEGRLIGASADGTTAQPSEEWFGQVDLVRRMMRVGHNVSSSGALLRRSAWLQAGDFDGIRFEQAGDTEFWIRLAGVGPVVVIKPALVKYRLHDSRDSNAGKKLYRHRPLPIIPVLRYWSSQDGVRRCLAPDDLRHFAISCADEYCRIALALCEDGRVKSAYEVLGELPAIDPSLLFVLVRDGRRASAARLVAAKALRVATRIGMARGAAAALRRSKIGYGGFK